MTSDQIANFAYLALMGTAVAGWFFVQNRDNLGKSLQQALLWGLIFLGTIAAVGLWSDIRSTVSPSQASLSAGVIEVPRSFDGHYYLSLTINDAPIRFVVDTGATDMVLSLADAQSVGINTNTLRFDGSATTANGIVGTATVFLDTVQLDDILDRDFRASVNQGDLDTSLLGMGYLQRFSRIEIANNRLLLTR
jgi:aspartyl protease family protein